MYAQSIAPTIFLPTKIAKQPLPKSTLKTMLLRALDIYIPYVPTKQLIAAGLLLVISQSCGLVSFSTCVGGLKTGL